MPELSRPEQIRRLIGETLVRLGARTDSSQRDALLIRGGIYCGHRITRDKYHAVWFVEEDEIKFYGSDGTLIDRMSTSEALKSLAARRQAA